MTDAERLDWLEAQLRRADLQKTHVLLAAWWSGRAEPDGFSVAVDPEYAWGRAIPNANESVSLREAIDEAARST